MYIKSMRNKNILLYTEEDLYSAPILIEEITFDDIRTKGLSRLRHNGVLAYTDNRRVKILMENGSFLKPVIISIAEFKNRMLEKFI